MFLIDPANNESGRDSTVAVKNSNCHDTAPHKQISTINEISNDASCITSDQNDFNKNYQKS